MNISLRKNCCRLRKTDEFAGTVNKTDVLGLRAWRPRRPQDGLLAPKTASRRPPGAQDGLQTGLQARKTASDGPPDAPDGFRTASRRAASRPSRPPDAPDGVRRLVHLPTSSPADKSALAPSEPSTPVLFCRSRRTAVTTCLTRQPPDELSCMSTLLHVNLLPSHYATGSH